MTVVFVWVLNSENMRSHTKSLEAINNSFQDLKKIISQSFPGKSSIPETLLGLAFPGALLHCLPRQSAFSECSPAALAENE